MRPPPAAPHGEEPPVRLAELIAALSLATDLGTGQPIEHALRSCVVAIRVALARKHFGEHPRVNQRETRRALLESLAGCDRC